MVHQPFNISLTIENSGAPLDCRDVRENVELRGMHCPPARTERIKRSLDKAHARAERAKMLQRAAGPAKIELTQIGGNIVHIAIAKINEPSELLLRANSIIFQSFNFASILYSPGPTLFCRFVGRQVGCNDMATKGRSLRLAVRRRHQILAP